MRELGLDTTDVDMNRLFESFKALADATAFRVDVDDDPTWVPTSARPSP